jgi:cell division protein FtsB
MGFGRMLRRKARAAAAPCIFLLLVAYFLWSATQGAHGLRADAGREQELEAAIAERAQAERELAVWQRRVAALHVRIDGDALDERARAMLNLADPRDVIVPYDKGQRLF